jgi:sigma-E factor negative regulatory protein RseB
VPALAAQLRRAAYLLQCLAVTAAAASATGATLSPGQWLARMDRALGDLTYRGDFAYLEGGELASLRIVHAVIDGVQHERLVHLDGPRREIVREGETVLCAMHRGDPLLELGRRFPAGPFTRAFAHGFADVPATYRARMAGEGRVAGRPAVRLVLDPDDDSRYGYRLWLDQATALPLRSELVAPTGEALEVFQFVRLEVGGPVERAELAPPEGDELVFHRLAFAGEDEAQLDEAEGWEAGWVPGGFRIAARGARRNPETPGSTLLYSDGLATLSVFVEALEEAPGYEHSMQAGATVAVVRRLETRPGHRWQVTVVGEVPLATAERVAGSVRHRAP